MTSIGPHTLKLPRLRVRDKLLQDCPEVAELLGIQERLIGAVGVPGASGKLTKKIQMNTMSAAGRSLLAGSLMDEEISQEELLRQEMASVKNERARLLEQLTMIKTDPGKAGADLQQDDILNLRREVEIKKAKLDELHEELLLKEKEVSKLVLESQDCTRLMPDGCPEQVARLSELRVEQAAIATESAEAGAKHRLYTLLEARTKRELQAMTNEVTAAQSLQWAYKEDEAALLIYVHAMNAALQETLKARQEAAQHLEDTRDDWALKLQARHKEVQELQRRQQEDTAKEERRLKAIADMEAAEQEKKAEVMRQEEQYALSLQAMQPQLEALEEAWSRLHTITGADSPDKLIAYWKGLKVQEQEMVGLAALAEAKQKEAKDQIRELLASRSRLLESNDNGQDTAQSLPLADLPNDPKLIDRLEEAQRRSQVAKKQFGKFRDVCVSAQQGLVALLGRVDAALEKADVSVGQYARRRSAEAPLGRQRSSVMRQSTLSKTGSLTTATDRAAAQKLHRLYTIDQDAFFPDLPALVLEVAEKAKALTALAKQAAGRPGEAKAWGQPPVRWESETGSESRRRTWVGAPWLLEYNRIQEHVKTSDNKIDVSRLVGYTEEPNLVRGRTSEEEVEDSAWDGVVTRQILKNRAAKLVQKHKVSVAAAAAAAAAVKA